jgi:MYND finger
VFSRAISKLVSMGPSPPEQYLIPGIDLSYGFGPYFVQQGLIAPFIEHVKNSSDVNRKALYLECLANFVAYPQPFVNSALKEFVLQGGIEMLRTSFAAPGDSILRSKNKVIKDLGIAIQLYLSLANCHFRLCSSPACKKRETVKEEWKECGKCSYVFNIGRFNAYCSRECQMEDWKSHKRICKPAN